MAMNGLRSELTNITFQDVMDNESFQDRDIAEQAKKDNEKSLDQYLWIYVSPIIFCTGVCGNSLTILVMRQKRMRGTSTCVYLTAMALADLGMLCVGIVPEWLEQCEFITMKELNPWLCKLEKFLFYTVGDVAIWIIVAFTVDRFVAVCFPLKKRQVCTPKRAKIGCLTIVACAILKNSHVFWTRGLEYDEQGDFLKNCGRPAKFEHFELYIRPWIAFALVSAVPFLVILICNICIVKSLVGVRSLRASASDNTKTFTQTTAMCLSASITFLVLITPSVVLLIGKPYWTSEEDPSFAYDIAKAVNNQLVYVNHSINFLLYCLTGERFREELLVLICRKEIPRRSTLTSYTSTPRKYNGTSNGSRFCSTPMHTPMPTPVPSPTISRAIAAFPENGVIQETVT